jgi:hypothetical protein
VQQSHGRFNGPNEGGDESQPYRGCYDENYGRAPPLPTPRVTPCLSALATELRWRPSFSIRWTVGSEEAAVPTVAGVALKLRILAWQMNVECADCANHDGVRTNELEPNELIVASALADADHLAGDSLAA